MPRRNFVIHTDGASRGNPGPASLGVVFLDKKGKAEKEYAKYLGEMTNNEAEYEAALFALKKFKALKGKEKCKESKIIIKTDSELLTRQMEGEYKIKEPNIQELFLKLWNLKIDFGEVCFESIPREENKRADELANRVLDEKLSQKKLI